MEQSKAIGYCGLACCVCGQEECPGCRAEGCPDRSWCEHIGCSREKGLQGCWECENFPCDTEMYRSNMRLRAFVRFIRAFGVQRLVDCLVRNEKIGMVYHYPDSLKGDYDKASSEAEVIGMLLRGRAVRGEKGEQK